MKRFKQSRSAADREASPCARPEPQELAPRQVADSWAHLRKKINELAIADGEWAGYPMPIDGLKLVVEKRHPRAATLNGAEVKAFAEADAPPEKRPVAQLSERKVNAGEIAAALRWNYLMNTLAVAANNCWSIEAEAMAVSKLRELVSDQAFKCYMLCGCFLETSKRSRVTYLFRKLRPTIALRETVGGNVWPIAVLCLHPIGLYEQSWAGVMVPTDDVIAHLMMMRADEHLYWRKANHHPIESPSAGI